MNPAHDMAAETEAEATVAALGFDRERDGYLEDCQRKRGASFVRYLVAISIGAGGGLACQLFGETQTSATVSPVLARWGQLEWTRQSADLENAAVWLSAAEAPRPRPVAQVITESLDEMAQRQQIALSLAALRQTVEQIAGGQEKMTNEIKRLAADVEMLSKLPTHLPQPSVASARKPVPTPRPQSPPPLTLHP